MPGRSEKQTSFLLSSFYRSSFHTNSLAASFVTTNTLGVTFQGDKQPLKREQGVTFLEEDIFSTLAFGVDDADDDVGVV